MQCHAGDAFRIALKVHYCKHRPGQHDGQFRIVGVSRVALGPDRGEQSSPIHDVSQSIAPTRQLLSSRGRKSAQPMTKVRLNGSQS